MLGCVLALLLSTSVVYLWPAGVTAEQPSCRGHAAAVVIVVTLLNQWRCSLEELAAVWSQLGSSGGRGNVMRDHSDGGPGPFLYNHIINLLILPLSMSWQIRLCSVHNGEVLCSSRMPLFWKAIIKPIPLQPTEGYVQNSAPFGPY